MLYRGCDFMENVLMARIISHLEQKIRPLYSEPFSVSWDAILYEASATRIPAYVDAFSKSDIGASIIQ